MYSTYQCLRVDTMQTWIIKSGNLDQKKLSDLINLYKSNLQSPRYVQIQCTSTKATCSNEDDCIMYTVPSAQLNFQVNLRQFAHWLAEEILS